MEKTQTEENSSNAVSKIDTVIKKTGRKKRRVLSSSETHQIYKLVHEWAFTDSKRNPQKFSRLFDKIWSQRFYE